MPSPAGVLMRMVVFIQGWWWWWWWLCALWSKDTRGWLCGPESGLQTRGAWVLSASCFCHQRLTMSPPYHTVDTPHIHTWHMRMIQTNLGIRVMCIFVFVYLQNTTVFLYNCSNGGLDNGIRVMWTQCDKGSIWDRQFCRAAKKVVHIYIYTHTYIYKYT